MKKSLLVIVRMMAAIFFCTRIGSAAIYEPGGFYGRSFEAPLVLAPDVPEDDDILYGDANGDGVINVLDLIAIISFIMGGNPDPFDFEAADVNNDGIINILDIIFEANIIMQVPGNPCAGMPTVTYSGQTYNTVMIGQQCWFRENLNVGTEINSTLNQTNNGTIDKYCHGNLSANCAVYGGLYQWDELMDYSATMGSQGICPVGWHVPTEDEVCTLSTFLDPTVDCSGTGWLGTDCGGKLKETGTSHWTSPNQGATNASGFTGLPGGYRDPGTLGFNTLGASMVFWTSNESGTVNAWERDIVYHNDDIGRYDINSKLYGYSARCIKNCTPQPTQANAGPDQLNISGIIATLNGNPPAEGTGTWSIISGYGGTINTPGNPASTFTGQPGNDYTLRWTITNDCGSTNDDVEIGFSWTGFSCSGNITDPRDGQVYQTVQIGSQCWMKQNLNIGTKINHPSNQTNNSVIEKFCYGNSEVNCTIYGALYQWNEMMGYSTIPGTQGICPDGWFIPSNDDWDEIANFLGGNPVAGAKMAETGTVHWDPPNSAATNESGFTAFGGGRSWPDVFGDFGQAGYFWASNESGSTAWIRAIYNSGALLDPYTVGKMDSRSVRCLRAFTCGAQLIDHRDGKSYGTVQIGTQCWMAENINMGTRINGSQSQTNNGVIEKFCFDDNESNCDEYGGLYQWAEAMQFSTTPGVQGICPAGWYVPTQDDYNTVIGFLGGTTAAGGKMKETGLEHWNAPNEGATNESGFGLLGSGERDGAFTNFILLKEMGYLWSSTQTSTTHANLDFGSFNSAGFGVISAYKPGGFAVRCIRTP